jgi:hypothetical protein
MRYRRLLVECRVLRVASAARPKLLSIAGLILRSLKPAQAMFSPVDRMQFRCLEAGI